ncbi:MAG: NTP transferase domain-containing protein [Planctomycetota bacterium]
MRAIILAAGRGSRLGHPHNRRPKCLLPFLEKPLLEWTLGTLRAEGFTDIHLVTGWHAEEISFAGVTLHHNAAHLSTNMVHSLFCSGTSFRGDVLVSYADILYERRILRALMKSKGLLRVVVDDDFKPYYQHRFGGNLGDAESLVLEGSMIREIGTPRPDPGKVQGQYLGLVAFNAEGCRKAWSQWHRLRSASNGGLWRHSRSVSKACMTDFIQELIDTGTPAQAVRVQRGWLEFDTGAELRAYNLWERESILGRYINVRECGG